MEVRKLSHYEFVFISWGHTQYTLEPAFQTICVYLQRLCSFYNTPDLSVEFFTVPQQTSSHFHLQSWAQMITLCNDIPGSWQNEKIKESVLFVKLNYFHAKDCCLLYNYILSTFWVLTKYCMVGFLKPLKIKKIFFKECKSPAQYLLCNKWSLKTPTNTSSHGPVQLLPALLCSTRLI